MDLGHPDRCGAGLVPAPVGDECHDAVCTRHGRVRHVRWRCVREPAIRRRCRFAVTPHSLHRCGRHRRRWRSRVIGRISPPLPVNAFRYQTAGLYGGERWVAHTGTASRGRVINRRGPSGIGGPRRRRVQVSAPTRGGRTRGAVPSTGGAASSHSHMTSSCRRRISSASTIAAASSSRLLSHWMSSVISLTPFNPDAAPRARRPAGPEPHALMAVLSVLLVIEMRRGLAFSATGMVNRNTPPA